MKKRLITILTIPVFGFATVSDKEIANMFILGFYGADASKNSKIYNDICNKNLGGVILFKNSPVQKGKIKNFSNRVELKNLTEGMKSCGAKPLIAIDQEGGLVQRVKFKYKYPRASEVAKNGESYANRVYSLMSKELKDLGFNLNFAPVADLALNPRNRVIVRYGRSYGSSVDNVVKYDKIFIDAMHKNKIATSLKHFPGHGSSLGDTHKGFVDVTNLWQPKELEPYKKLKNITDTVMVAHIFNKKLDSDYPASLSKKVVTNLLRGDIGYKGVIVSDDLQMGAISKKYGLKNTIKLSINAGIDIMLFANQVAPKRVVSLEKVVPIVRSLLDNNEISEKSIKDANRRINRLKNRLY